MSSENWYNRIIASITIVAFLLSIAWLVWDKHYSRETLSENGRYTIGSIYRIVKTTGGYLTEFKFMYQKMWLEDQTVMKNRYKKDHLYFVKYSSKDISINRILVNIPVPDTVRESPPNGWSPEEFKELFGEEIPN